MKYYLIVLTILLSTHTAWGVLPTCYHTYEQIHYELVQLQETYPTKAQLVTIGHSQQDGLPIYAMKITNQVQNENTRPKLLFIGQVHAEEVLGVETTMFNISDILAHAQQQPYSRWLSELEMWFIPTLNPEGHNVVTSNINDSYRKNKRDVNNNGIFDWDPRVGYDIDGVDINRNFSFNWCHGDGWMAPPSADSPEAYDYYKGASPMSESETQAIKTLADDKKFVYSIVWHSSRTGNLSEKCYYSFNWKNVRPSPDMALAQSIASGIASQIQKETGGGYYQALPNLSRKGAFHDWMYQQYGTIQVLIECGTANLQPDSLLMVNTVQRCTNGVYWLLNRALSYYASMPSSSILMGNVLEAGTNSPLEAEIVVSERNAPWFRPRMSNASTGKFWRPISAGTYNITFRKKGYYDQNYPGFIVNPSAWTNLQATMTKKPDAIIQGSVTSAGQDIPAQIIIYDVVNDTLSVNGDFILNTTVGTYSIEVYSEGFYPYLGTVTLTEGINQIHVELAPATTIFSENWENGMQNWEQTGRWVLQNELAVSGNAITDSQGGLGLYDVNCNVWIKTVNPIQLPSRNNIKLMWDQQVYTEWVYDTVRVEISTDNLNWTTIYTKTGQYDWWDTEYVSLDAYAGNTIWLRFRLTDISTEEDLTDPGWTIDNIRIVTGSSTANNDLHVNAPVFALYGNYPNPFNPSTTIQFEMAQTSSVELCIYNLRGQKVRTLIKESLAKGRHTMKWDGRDEQGKAVSSGVYYTRLQAGNQIRTAKMVLMK